MLALKTRSKWKDEAILILCQHEKASVPLLGDIPKPQTILSSYIFSGDFVGDYLLNIHVFHTYKYMHIYKHTYTHTFYMHKYLLLPTPKKTLDFQAVNSSRRKRSTVVTVISLFKLPWKAANMDQTLCSLFHAKHKIHAAVAKNITINLQID